jgi:hypothetical protein
VSRRAKLWLGSEILVAYLTARWYLRQGALPSVVARLRRVPPEPAPGPMGAEQGARLGRAVGRTLSVLPFDSRCLLRSLVLVRLLARRGETADLVIAARPGEAEGFDAHAWVEVAGYPVLPPAVSPYGRLVTL